MLAQINPEVNMLYTITQFVIIGQSETASSAEILIYLLYIVLLNGLC